MDFTTEDDLHSNQYISDDLVRATNTLRLDTMPQPAPN